MARYSFLKTSLIVSICLAFPLIGMTEDAVNTNTVPQPHYFKHSSPPQVSSAPPVAAFEENPPGHAPIKELPEGATVSSIIAKIIEHGDLRDKEFIGNVFGLHSNHRGIFAYGMTIPHTQPQRGFYLVYRTYTLGETYDFIKNHSPNQAAEISFNFIDVLPCIDFMDFKQLFDTEPKDSSGVEKGSIAHVFQKNVNSDFYLTLSVTSKNSCATDIVIGMFKK